MKVWNVLSDDWRTSLYLQNLFISLFMETRCPVLSVVSLTLWNLLWTWMYFLLSYSSLDKQIKIYIHSDQTDRFSWQDLYLQGDMGNWNWVKIFLICFLIRLIGLLTSRSRCCFSLLLSVSGLDSVVSGLTRSNCWKLKGLYGWSLWISLCTESLSWARRYEGFELSGDWGSLETLYLLFCCFANVWEVKSK